MPEAIVNGTRAVERVINPGNEASCAHCGQRVKFKANQPFAYRRQVFCNIYEGDRWHRLEVFHSVCYKEAGEPYGVATT